MPIGQVSLIVYGTKKPAACAAGSSLVWPWQESNLHLRLRKPTYYPLYYRAILELSALRFARGGKGTIPLARMIPEKAIENDNQKGS